MQTLRRFVDFQVQRDLAEIAGASVDAAQAGARRLVGRMGLALQAGLMLRYAPSASAEAFIGSRLGEDRGIDYGVLPAGTGRSRTILARH